MKTPQCFRRQDAFRLILVCAFALMLIPGKNFGAADPPPPPPPPPPLECDSNWFEVVQAPSGAISYTNVAVWPEKIFCLGSWFCAWPEAQYTCSDAIYRTVWSHPTTNCPAQYYTNTCQYPYFETNWWVLSYPGQSDSQQGSGMCFFPTNCGNGRVTFYGIWRNWNPCTGQPMGGGTISKLVDFKVINLQTIPGYTNALINRCKDPNRSVTYCLTNSCYPGGVAWSIFPVVTNGATITGSGGCATVKIGNAVQDYTITATSNDNTNCTASAGLSVTRDCICTNHIINPNPTDAPGLSTSSPSCPPNGNFPYGSYTSQCGSVLSLNCNGAVFLTLDGATVGHCPYLASSWWARYWPCNCGDMIMKTQFQVQHVAPFNLGPGSGKGKIETRTCASGFNRWCYETSGAGQRIDRVGGCTQLDE